MYLKKKMMFIGIVIFSALSISACKPTYETPVNDPVMTTAPADAPYEMDFVQLNNDVIDDLSRKADIFPFIKSIELDGDNDKKTIEVDIDIQKDITDDAVQILLSDVTKRIGNNAYIQDFRLKKADDTQFGTVFNIYSYNYKVTSGEDVLYDDTIPAGDSIPLDPSLDADAVEYALDQIGEAQNSTVANDGGVDK